MTAPTLGTSPELISVEDDLDAKSALIHRELVHEFACRQAIGCAVTVGVTFMIAAVLWDKLPHNLLLIWTLLQSVLAVASWLRWQPFTDRVKLRRPFLPTSVEAGAWKLGSGLLWGVLAFVVHLNLMAPFDNFVFLILAGMVAGSTSTLSAFRSAGIAYIVGVLLPSAVAFAIVGTAIDLALGVLCLVFMVAMIGTVRVNHKAILTVITERFRNEKMGRSFQAERDTWLDISNTTEAFAVFDEDDRLLSWNERYGELMQEPDELLRRGTPRTTLIRAGRLPKVVLSGEETIANWIAYKSHFAADWTVEEYDGGAWIRRRVSKTKNNLLAVSFVDVTQLVRAEQALIESEGRFRALVENMPGGFILKDSDLRIRLATGAVYDSVHLVSGDERIGKRLADILSPEDAAAVDKIDRRVLETGQVDERIESYVGPSGREIVVRNVRFPILDDDGQIIGVGCVTHDVTEEQQIEAQLQQAQKMEMVGQLTGGIAHDFNNLLTAILGNAELLRDHVADDPVGETLLRNLLRATERGGDLTQRLLAFSRRQNLQPEIVDVAHSVDEVAALLERTLEERITLQFNVSENLPRVFIDPVQLESAMINLAVNARDAMREGGTLSISTDIFTVEPGGQDFDGALTPGRYIELAVTDNGSGMSADVVEHIFEPFYTTKEPGKGTGLGLSMVYGFAKQSGGHVTVSSVEWDGTTVKLYLPVADREELATSNAGDEGLATEGGRETVLVIEDDEDVLAFVEASLAAKGYSVVTASDGVAALERLNDGLEIDLLLSDVILPRGVTGPEVARQMLGRHPELPVVFMSGYTRDALNDTDWPEMGYDLIQKPFTRETLYARVRESLDQSGL